jgi:hypothetical protein
MEWLQLGDRDDADDDPGEAPETPLDEPTPPRVEDPPPQPDQRPYVVHADFTARDSSIGGAP